ncbi:MAG TPA: vitamin K epoxide reductase family protein [Gemmatimonadaceae bacterium]|nr:vitamin K epoxide reductase family protein [Gemmatimonadaceae bacterium]
MRRRSADRLAIALATVGLLIAAYLTLLHYDSGVRLVCSAGAFVNCETVLTSPSATFAGVPVAVWGLAWFGVALVLAVLLLRDQARDKPNALRLASRAWTAAGVIGVLYLVYQEVGVVGKICAWCTAVHLIVLAMAIVQFTETPAS